MSRPRGGARAAEPERGNAREAGADEQERRRFGHRRYGGVSRRRLRLRDNRVAEQHEGPRDQLSIEGCFPTGVAGYASERQAYGARGWQACVRDVECREAGGELVQRGAGKEWQRLDRTVEFHEVRLECRHRLHWPCRDAVSTAGANLGLAVGQDQLPRLQRHRMLRPVDPVPDPVGHVYAPLANHRIQADPADIQMGIVLRNDRFACDGLSERCDAMHTARDDGIPIAPARTCVVRVER